MTAEQEAALLQSQAKILELLMRNHEALGAVVRTLESMADLLIEKNTRTDLNRLGVASRAFHRPPP